MSDQQADQQRSGEVEPWRAVDDGPKPTWWVQRGTEQHEDEYGRLLTYSTYDKAQSVADLLNQRVAALAALRGTS